MSDGLVADTEKINTAGDTLQRLAQDFEAIREKLPVSDDLSSTTASEESFLRAWRSMRNDLWSYARQLQNNLDEQGGALKTVAGEHEALDQDIADDFGGLIDDDYVDRRDEFDASEGQRDHYWDNPYSHYQHR